MLILKKELGIIMKKKSYSKNYEGYYTVPGLKFCAAFWVRVFGQTCSINENISLKLHTSGTLRPQTTLRCFLTEH